MRLTPRSFYISISIILAFAHLAAGPADAAADPVDSFIVTADSLATAGGEEALSGYVVEHEILVGASVALLLDVAFDVGEAGDKAGEAENVDFCERVARVLKDQGGSDVPLQLVATYRGWNADERAVRAQAKSLHDKGNANARGGQPDTAVAQLKQAMALFEQIDDRHSVAVVWGSLGVADWYRGDLAAAAADYKQALAARRAVEDRILEGKTLNGLGSVNLRLGDLAAAVDYYNQAIELRRRTGDQSGLGTSITYLGHVYLQQNRLADARDQYQKAVVILETQGNSGALVDLLNGIAICYAEMGRWQRANSTYRRAIRVAQAAGEPQKEISCRTNLANNYWLAARFAEAFAELDTTAALLDRHPDTVAQARLHSLRGLTYKNTEFFDQARDDLLRCAELAAEIGDPDFLCESLINVGFLYVALGAYDNGLEVGLQAKKMAEENGLARQYRSAVVLLGELNMQKAEYASALEYFQEALEQDEYDGMARKALEDKFSIAVVHAGMGETKEARRLLYEIAPEAGSVGGDNMIISLHLSIGHTFENENPDSASFHYEAALALFERAHATVSADESQGGGFLSGRTRFYFEEIARYYASLDGAGWTERAFATVERAKARGLLELLIMAELNRTSAEEEEILDRLYRLDSGAEDYQTQADRLQVEYDRTRERRLKQALGPLAEQGETVTIEDVKKALPKKTVMLQYALGDTTSLMWVIDRKGQTLVTLPNRSELHPEVVRLRDAIGQPGAGDAVLRKSARSLYQVLVAPAEKQLENAEQLIIVPDGFLHEIPFDVLMTAEPDAGAGWASQPYLAQTYATVYAPSAAIYLALRAKDIPQYDLDLVAFGDPDFSLHTGSGAEFDALPHARAEVNAIGDYVTDDHRVVRLGAEANEAALKRQLDTTSSRAVHLATHGLVNPAEPATSSVVLCPDSAGIEDGYLRTMEILAISTDAGLVVVSACESGRGRVSRGEGVVGLSRAFIASGAGGVVASLWAVSDESTSVLMSEFYKYMLSRKRPAGNSLREAKLALIDDERYAHPFYWSAFIFIGTDQSPW
jgi:CHAT domain-containing protein/Flp pilus assembly protein TadD